jgi:uncharacterized membrane protein
MSQEPEIIMPKNRLEALSDGVFAIVLTLLILEIKVPELHSLSNSGMLHELQLKLPLFATYFLSFALITNFWVSHHFMFLFRARNVDRIIILINSLYLCLLSLIPFSSHFLGSQIDSQVAAIFYGVNISLVSIIFLWMSKYALQAEHIESDQFSNRIRKQGNIRQYIVLIFNFLGIICSFINIPLALLFYFFPVVFNIIPGFLNSLEKIFGFEIK